MKKYLQNKKIWVTGTLTMALSACATVENPDPNDPLESYNRSMFQVNEAVDGAVLKPLAKTYEVLVPSPARTCVSNIFGNLGDVWSGINSILQGRGLDAVNTFGRVLFNTTVGLGGCIDVASMNGAEKIPNDFGTTLGVWGIGQGPHIVLPILGSSTVRDTFGQAADSIGSYHVYVSPWSIENVPLRNGVVVLDALDTRYQLIDADELASEISLDKYSFVRDAYLQNRAALLKIKKGPEITDGTKVEKGSFNDPYDPDNPEYAFKKKTFNGYIKTTDDLDSELPSYEDPTEVKDEDDLPQTDESSNKKDDGLPQYNDPDDNSSTAQDDDLPQYDDPEENASKDSDNQSKESSTKEQESDLPQYDDPEDD